MLAVLQQLLEPPRAVCVLVCSWCAVDTGTVPVLPCVLPSGIAPAIYTSVLLTSTVKLEE